MNRCAPANDGNGTALCLQSQVVRKESCIAPCNKITDIIFTWNVTLSGIGFYPPSNEPSGHPPVTPFQLSGVSTFSESTLNFPFIGCTNINQSEVICAMEVNSELQPILLNSNTKTLSGLAPLPFNITNTPSCTSGGNAAAICAVSEGGGLTGFAFDPNGLKGMIQLGGSGLSNPSCTTPQDGSNLAICAATNGTTLFGIAFDPRTGFHTAFQNLGAAPDTGQWLGQVSCAPSNDTLNNGRVTCAAISSSGSVFAFKFDPRAAFKTGVFGPFFSGAGSDLSCVKLAIDPNQITCGVIRSGGGSSGFNVPIPAGP